MEISLAWKKIMAFGSRMSHTHKFPSLAGTRFCLISEVNLDPFLSPYVCNEWWSAFSGSSSISDRKFIFDCGLKRLP